MENILITGCNGLIGKVLVNQLKQSNFFNLFGIGRSSDTIENTFIIDLSEEWQADKLPKKMDVIIHLAQSEKFRDFPQSANSIFNVNTNSTLKLLDYARNAGVKKFIYASSGGVYGNSQEEFNESASVSVNNNLGFYLSTKLCSELLVQSYSSFFNINILRFFFVFGKEQRKDMLIPRLINSVNEGLPISLQGKDGLKINPIYVEDAVEAIINCIQINTSSRINIAGNETLTLRAACQVIGKLVNKKPNFIIEDVEPKNLVADITKMKELLIHPKISFEQGILKML